jgi:hypothetical protein
VDKEKAGDGGEGIGEKRRNQKAKGKNEKESKPPEAILMVS